MEKINLVELLKDCPNGMKLDCTAYDNVSFDKISNDKKEPYPIFCYITDEEGNRSSISFTENGCESKRYGAKCVIFPKGKTTWEWFHRPFKVGDRIRSVISLSYYTIIGIEDDQYVIQPDEPEKLPYHIDFDLGINYELVPNKFEISTLKPFESRVLVRDKDLEIWRVSFWGCLLEKREEYRYDTTRGAYAQCIPYEGNEHLLGTYDDCDEYFKNWK